jgi:competence protein ComEC
MSATGLGSGGRIALGGLAWLAGVAMQLQQARLWPAPTGPALLAAAALLLVLGWRLPQAADRWRDGLMVAALVVAGFGATAWRAELRLADGLDPAFEGRDLELTGIVAAMPQQGASGTRFVLEVESALFQGRPAAVPSRIALGWYRGFGDEAALADPLPDLRAGQRWQLPVRLKQPHGTLNPHGFDAELWWFEQNLRATGYVRVARGGAPARLLADTAAHPVERARQAIRDAILARVADPRVAGVLAALVVGDQAAIER